MSRSHHCPHCNHPELRRPPRWGLLAVALAWAWVAVMVFAAALIGPFIIPLIPVMLAFGGAAVTSAHDAAFAPPECERCGKVVLAEASAAVAPRLVPALARAA